jgi:hypothetical protein
MGGEWSKAVGMIFKQKYSNGRGKLSDAMKDPATRALHAQLKGGKTVKGGKTRKMRGGAGPAVKDEVAAGPEAAAETKVSSQSNDSKSLEDRVTAIEEKLTRLENAEKKGGFPAKSKKSRKVKSRRN